MNIINRFYILAFVIMVSLTLSTSAQVLVDQAVARSAQAAVQKFGLEMMKGNLDYGNERIYPRWKRRLAKRYGGNAQLNAALQEASRQKLAMKYSVTVFQASVPSLFFDVWRAPKVNAVTGLPVTNAMGRDVVVEHWLAVVPTLTRLKIADPQMGGKIREIEERGYSVTVSEKGSDDWYFLTGMVPNEQNLRALFPKLPANFKALGFPEIVTREIK